MTLKDRRNKMGINQIEAAKRLGVEQSYYSRIERGRENPTIGVFERLAGIYNAEVDQLVREWIEVRATLPPDASSIDSPGWMCLRQITRPLAAATRTLVPSATPHLKVA